MIYKDILRQTPLTLQKTMINSDNNFSRSDQDTPTIVHRPDGRYLAHSGFGSKIMIGVYGVSEKGALETYLNRVRSWRESIEIQERIS
ncbi:MAG: hypothetical protein DHS20C01_30440 [marine bacterium B5-7]|nr:MAG: hypothetical protein DHS20C01_30440 [marine bacterium B5-7]